jgi:hypothetical protein
MRSGAPPVDEIKSQLFSPFGTGALWHGKAVAVLVAVCFVFPRGFVHHNAAIAFCNPL